jgi:hypothetical protein
MRKAITEPMEIAFEPHRRVIANIGRHNAGDGTPEYARPDVDRSSGTCNVQIDACARREPTWRFDQCAAQRNVHQRNFTSGFQADACQPMICLSRQSL